MDPENLLGFARLASGKDAIVFPFESRIVSSRPNLAKVLGCELSFSLRESFQKADSIHLHLQTSEVFDLKPQRIPNSERKCHS